MRIAILLLLLGVASVSATNYYVRTDGNNSNSGLVNNAGGAKLTIAGAVSVISGGDTININDGVYTERVAFSTAKNGTLGSPTVIKAINPLMVTNAGGYTISQGGAGYIEFHDIIFQDGAAPSFEGIGQYYHNNSGAALGAGYVVSNCWFVGTQDPTSHRIYGLNMDTATNPAACAANFKLMSCVFTNNSDYMLKVAATNGLITGSRFDFANTHDAIHCWGMDIVISNNVFTNVSSNPLVSDHTDILQYWNDPTEHSVCSNVYFCDNLIINCDAQMFELQQDGNCSFYFTSNAVPLGGLYVFNNIYVNVDRPGYISIPDAHFWNNLWYKCRQSTNGGGSTALIFGGAANSCGIAYGCTITNCMFIDCGNSNYVNDTHNGWFNDGNTGGLTNFNADYNFVCGDTTNYPAKNVTDWTKSGTMNMNSINGGNPYLRAPSLGDYHLNKNSALINAGVAAAVFSQDFEGSTRPLGTAWCIGPYEFDPTLQSLFNFAVDFSGGTVSDLTGYGHDGIRFSLTNWPTSVTSSNRAAAQFTVRTGNVLSPPDDSGWGDYIAVTNLSNISRLTNGTVTMWARYYQTKAGGTNWNEASTQRLFDAGFQGSPWSAGTFFIGRGYDPVSGDVAHTVMRQYNTNGGLNPTTFFAYPDGTAATGGDTLAWHFYGLTWDGTNCYGYFDGTNFASTNMSVPAFVITNDFNWYGMGCWTHNGTPQWDGDGYPNNGWFNGVMGESRIYSRALTAPQLYSLYTGGFASSQSSGGGGTSTTSATTIGSGSTLFLGSGATIFFGK